MTNSNVAKARELYSGTDKKEYKKFVLYWETIVEEAITIEYATMLLHRSIVARHDSQPEQEFKYIAKSIDISRELGDINSLGTALLNMGIWHGSRGKLQGALPFFEEAYELALQHNVDSLLGPTMSNMSTVYTFMGDFETALAWAQKSLPLKEQQGDQKTLGGLLHNIGVLYSKMGNNQEALDYYLRSLNIYEKFGFESEIPMVHGAIGTLHYNTGDYPSALEWLHKAIDGRAIHSDPNDNSSLFATIGNVYLKSGEPEEAQQWFEKSAAGYKKNQNDAGYAGAEFSLASAMFLQNKLQQSLDLCNSALNKFIQHDFRAQQESARTLRARIQLQLAIQKGSALPTLEFDPKKVESMPLEHVEQLGVLGEIAIASADYESALKHFSEALEIAADHTLRTEVIATHRGLRSVHRKLGNYAAALEHGDKIDELENERRDAERKRWLQMAKAERKHQSERQQAMVQRELLTNVLPTTIADRLLAGEQTVAEIYSNTTVVFLDIVGFTAMSTQREVRSVIEDLNNAFSAFDQICEHHGVTKVKTIGDAYLFVSGAPAPIEDHAQRAVLASKEILHSLKQFSVRVGICSGEIAAGVVGTTRKVWDIWGDTVNVAARMEQTAKPGMIQLAESTAEILAARKLDAASIVEWQDVTLHPLGQHDVKGKGLMNTWSVRT